MPAIDSTPTVTVLRRGRWTHHPHWFLRPGPNGRLMTLDADGGCVGSWHATDVCPHMDGTA